VPRAVAAFVVALALILGLIAAFLIYVEVGGPHRVDDHDPGVAPPHGQREDNAVSTRLGLWVGWPGTKRSHAVAEPAGYRLCRMVVLTACTRPNDPTMGPLGPTSIPRVIPACSRSRRLRPGPDALGPSPPATR
jgi:hypothetical protein